MPAISTELKNSLTIKNKYLDAGITNSYLAEMAGIPLGELYGIGEISSSDIKFRKRIMEDLHS